MSRQQPTDFSKNTNRPKRLKSESQTESQRLNPYNKCLKKCKDLKGEALTKCRQGCKDAKVKK